MSSRDKPGICLRISLQRPDVYSEYRKDVDISDGPEACLFLCPNYLPIQVT